MLRDPFIDETDPYWRILESARRIFAEYGYDRASISKICKDAGVNRAMVSYYHGGKRTLYQRIIESIGNHLVKVVREGVYEREGAIERLRAYIEITVEFQMTQPENRAIIDREISSNFAHAGDIVENYFLQLIAVLNDVIRQGIDSGDFDRSIVPMNTALFVYGAVNMYFLMTAFAKRAIVMPYMDRKQIGVIVDFLMGRIINGMLSGNDKGMDK